MTSTFTISATFTRTHAKHLASKVIADLHQCSLFYDHPTAEAIGNYEAELVEMLAHQYVDTYEFGFKSNGKRLVSWHYTVGPDGDLHGDAAAGGIYPKATVDGAHFFNFMTCSTAWWKLSESQRVDVEARLPIQRTPGSSPDDGDGYWQVDHAYSSGGVRVARKTFRPI